MNSLGMNHLRALCVACAASALLAGTSALAASPLASGPYAPTVDPELQREDLVVEDREPDGGFPARALSPAEVRRKERGFYQDPRTGRTRVLRAARPRPAGDFLPEEDGEVVVAPRPPEPLLSSPQAIFGVDSRVRFTPTTGAPFRRVVKLVIKYPLTPSGKAWGCTGSLIGGRHVLTAAHCVFKGDEGGWASSAVATPGRDDGASPFGSANMIGRRAWGWVNTGDAEDDFGLVTLDTKFGVGSFGLIYVSDDTLDDGPSAQLVGYPGEKGSGSNKGRQQWAVPGGGPITDYESYLVEYTIDTTKGQSGSGVYKFYNDKRCIFAVHHGSCGGVNCGARITKKRHDAIRAWQDEDNAALD